MMFDAGVVTFREFASGEPLPLATLHRAMLDFLRHRQDLIVTGDAAVNAYVSEPRMTQDIDLLSPRAAALAEELRDYLSTRFHIAVRIREVAEGRGFRLYQIQKPNNRHLADVRAVEALPSAQRIAQVLVIAPAELIAFKVIAYHGRREQPKSGTDWRDLAMLLLAFPELKQTSGPVAEALRAAGADEGALAVWRELVAQTIQPPEEDGEF